MTLQIARPVVLLLCASLLGGVSVSSAQSQQSDDRVGLAAGFRDAGVAARNIELVRTLAKPDGFFDPEAPAGRPRRPPVPDPPADAAADAEAQPAAPQPPAPGSGLSYTNTDFAFQGDHLFLGNYHGFNVYSIEDPTRAELAASIVCPGGQGDVSVYGNLLFMSVQDTRARLDCGVQGVAEPVSPERFRGVRIFDISDLRAPQQVAAVQTCRGSHTHTLIVDPDDDANVFLYNSGTSSVRPGQELAGCVGAPDPDAEESAEEDPDAPVDPNTSLFSIDVIQVPLAEPERSRIVSSPRVFANLETGDISGLWPGGDHGQGTQSSRETRQCHDITAYPEMGLAAGACSGNGILLDISDPVNPVRIDHVVDDAFAFWHSATFNNDGTKIVFTDEWGGGSRPRCRASDPKTWGANAIFDIVDGKMRFKGYYKLPAPQTEQENCVAHNGSLIPVPGRDIMVQGWYQGGLSIYDFSDSAHAVEIAYFDRGPVDANDLISGGYWSAYWYNGHVYGAEIARGLDVFRLLPSEHLSQNEIDAAALATANEVNVQHQQQVSWPDVPVVARAYMDQLERGHGIGMDRLTAVGDALDRVESGVGESTAMKADLDQLAADLQADSEEAFALNQSRLVLLAGTLSGIAAELR
ncbi:MAG: hypothetical protein GKS06_16525 [Acidobacteria bacterium]|nr:hypothetical protein [Acidobacteriota bacterium]